MIAYVVFFIWVYEYLTIILFVVLYRVCQTSLILLISGGIALKWVMKEMRKCVCMLSVYGLGCHIRTCATMYMYVVLVLSMCERDEEVPVLVQ